MRDGRFSGRVVLVTGAASGMGAAHARAFAAEGAAVVLADVDAAGLAVLHEELGSAAMVAELDVADADGWSAVVARIEARYARLDVLVNNAAVVMRRSIADTGPDDFRRVLEVNVTGAFLGIRAVADLMTRTGGGSIVNVSSTSGAAGFPGLSAYGTSKWAVRGLAKMAAAELAPVGIRVNAVLPGLVDTPMTASLKRRGGSLRGHPGTPEEVSAVVLFLASDEAAFVTGTDVAVDGGETAVSRAVDLNSTRDDG